MKNGFFRITWVSNSGKTRFTKDVARIAQDGKDIMARFVHAEIAITQSSEAITPQDKRLSDEWHVIQLPDNAYPLTYLDQAAKLAADQAAQHEAAAAQRIEDEKKSTERRAYLDSRKDMIILGRRWGDIAEAIAAHADYNGISARSAIDMALKMLGVDYDILVIEVIEFEHGQHFVAPPVMVIKDNRVIISISNYNTDYCEDAYLGWEFTFLPQS